MQTHQQAHQRRLASAARTNQSHSLRRRDMELEVFDDVARPAPRRVIRESHAFKMNSPFLNHQCRSPGAVLDGRRNDQSVDALARSSEMLVKLRYPLADIVSRLQKRGGQRRDHDEIAGADRATYPYIQRSPNEPKPHEDVQRVLHAAQPHDRAIESHATRAFLARVLLQLAILDDLVGKKEYVPNVGDHIDDAASHRRTRFI